MSVPDRELSGRRLVVAHLAWWLVCGPAIGLSLYGFGVGLQDPTLLGPEVTYRALAGAGISILAASVLGLVMPFLLLTAVSGVIYVRRPRSLMALVSSAVLISAFATTTRGPAVATTVEAGLEWAGRAVAVVGLGGFVVMFSIFPNARPFPRWSVWFSLAAVATLAAFPELLRVISRFPELPQGTTEGRWVALMTLLVVFLVGAMTMQVLRFRTSSTTLERQQIKWVTFPLGLAFAYLTVVGILPEIVGDPDPVWSGWAQLSLIPFSVLFPVSIAAAILRYRLYDIDRLISRTASYAIITALLVGVYAVSVLVAQLVVPGQSSLTVAVSTLAVAAVFNPLRRRVQAVVDRRFHRAHYDSARTLEQMVRRLRDIQEPRRLVGELGRVVETTFQPKVVAVWLAPDRDRLAPELRVGGDRGRSAPRSRPAG